MTTITSAFLAGLVVSFALEGGLIPRPRPPWRRPPAALLLHLGIWCLAYALMLAILQRPWFAASATLTLELILVLVNRAKFQALREPFIFQDIDYFIDTIKHPRLFLPFFGWWRALLAACVFAVALVLGLTLEAPLSGVQLVLSVAGLMLGGGLCLKAGGRERPDLSLEPETDIRCLGFFAALWRYALAEGYRPPLPEVASPPVRRPGRRPTSHVVVIQSESFFDPRDWYPAIQPQLFAEFDRLKHSARCYGRLQVPAWGANTVRTEFAFLSGLDGEVLGVHRFNPYRRLVRQPLPTLAWRFKHLGYRTICLHPYPASFYYRDRVYPLLGFDEFIDIAAFTLADYAGPYVGDVAVAEKVGKILAGSRQPVFLFVITMENHGPLHLESTHPQEIAAYYQTPPPPGCDELTIYLRHVSNADRAAGILRRQLSALPGRHWLCWYGDHVPILTSVYAKLGFPPGHTDFLIWCSGTPAIPQYLELRAEVLGDYLYQLVEAT